MDIRCRICDHLYEDHSRVFGKLKRECNYHFYSANVTGKPDKIYCECREFKRG